jgi:hypothetical protein
MDSQEIPTFRLTRKYTSGNSRQTRTYLPEEKPPGLFQSVTDYLWGTSSEEVDEAAKFKENMNSHYKRENILRGSSDLYDIINEHSNLQYHMNLYCGEDA